MTRDEKWGKVWAYLAKLYMATRGSTRDILQHQENFSKHPGIVFRKLYEDIHIDCITRGISKQPLLTAVSELDKADFSDEPLGEMYLHQYSAEMGRAK